MILPVTFDQIQSAERIYSALRPLSKELRDRILRHVNEALASERVPLRMPPVQHHPSCRHRGSRDVLRKGLSTTQATTAVWPDRRITVNSPRRSSPPSNRAVLAP